MSIFGGQYGSFGGGYLTGPGGTSQGPSMQFGGGFIQAPSGPAPTEVKVSEAEVVYAMDPTVVRVKDRSGRKGPYERRGGSWPFTFPIQPGSGTGGVHRQKRY